MFDPRHYRDVKIDSIQERMLEQVDALFNQVDALILRFWQGPKVTPADIQAVILAVTKGTDELVPDSPDKAVAGRQLRMLRYALHGVIKASELGDIEGKQAMIGYARHHAFQAILTTKASIIYT